MIQGWAQWWGEIFKQTLELRAGPGNMRVDDKMVYAEAIPDNDIGTDVVAWAKRFGEADLFL